jgi:hypothetical protein
MSLQTRQLARQEFHKLYRKPCVERSWLSANERFLADFVFLKKGI